MAAADTSQGTTAICGFDADSISVRGKDLVNDLMGSWGFIDAFLLQALGKPPSPQTSTIVNAGMVSGLLPVWKHCLEKQWMSPTDRTAWRPYRDTCCIICLN